MSAVFGKVLIANRGEIALRVARTCRELGVATVVAHSADDRDSAAVRYADQAVCVGPGPARQSYLNIPAVIEAALGSGADAIHPGYGFLSEDPDFAEVCERSGLVLIGPPARVLARLGDKSEAVELMRGAGLPVLPGSVRPVGDLAGARALAEEIGYPLIIKSVAGGGGRGMTVVHRERDLPSAYRGTRAAARRLFGDGRVYIERFVPRARHVEIQVLCDGFGNAVHLGERDCSVQRRNQKLLEESPAPALPPELGRRLGEAAVAGALAAGYEGAGTFEFLVDEDGGFWFIEVNCRLQVEHPVTEMTTGLDLVEQQLLIAAGRPLALSQDDVRPRGAAVECRINAEDPDAGFAPAPGTLVRYREPGGPFVRVDSHAFPGYRVPPHYDALLAKLIVWAPDRPAALRRMRRALRDFEIEGPGVRTTAGFLGRVLDEPGFRAGRHHTSLVAEILGGAGELPADAPGHAADIREAS